MEFRTNCPQIQQNYFLGFNLSDLFDIRWSQPACTLLAMAAVEKHYSVAEISAMWGYSPNTIRKLFQEEKGVLKIGSPETRFKRKRFQLSIPESVLVRVHNERSN